MSPLGLCRTGVLVCWAGLFALLFYSLTVAEPPRSTPRALALLLGCGPLLLALRGVLHRRTYTHAWLSLLALLYFALTLSHAIGRSDWLAWLMAASSLGLFVSSTYFVRYEARRLRAMQAGEGAATP